MGEENTDKILTDQILRELIEDALRGAREDAGSQVAGQLDSDEELNAYSGAMASAIRELLTPESVGAAFDRQLEQPDVQNRIRDGGMTQSDISQQRQVAIDIIGQMLDGSLSSSSLQDTIKEHVQDGLAGVPGLVDLAIDRHVEAAVDNAAEARQRMFNTMANQPSMPDEQQLNDIERDMMDNAVRRFAEQFAGIKATDPEQYELYKDAFANSDIHQRAFAIVDSGALDVEGTEPGVSPDGIKP